MILFRRVGEAFRHIEDREWILLALETLGVLAGILIAFELQEWGQRRSEAARHRQLMERLFEETENDVASIRVMRNVLKPMVEREELFATRIGNGECPATADFQAMTTLGMMPALTMPTSVYQELMGAGGLSSIERDDVRNHLAKLHEDLEWSQKQIDYFRTFAISMDPVPESDRRVTVRFDSSADDPLKSAFNGPALCSDPVFKNKLAAATRQHRVLLHYFQDPLEDAISVCVRLGDSLGHTCTPPTDGPLTGEDAQIAAKARANMIKERAKT
jgi:hypothetical protein